MRRRAFFRHAGEAALLRPVLPFFGKGVMRTKHLLYFVAAVVTPTDVFCTTRSQTPTIPFFSGLFMGQDLARGSGHEVFKNSRVESDPVRRCSKSHRSGWVEPGEF